MNVFAIVGAAQKSVDNPRQRWQSGGKEEKTECGASSTEVLILKFFLMARDHIARLEQGF